MNNNEDVYLLMKDTLKEQYKYSLVPGVSIEIRDFLSAVHAIEGYQLTVDKENIYQIRITMKELDHMKVQEIFFSFFCFLSYSDASCYVRDVTSDRIHYTFASFAGKNLRFCCEMDFLKQTE
jgi:hypothetical protein